MFYANVHVTTAWMQMVDWLARLLRLPKQMSELRPRRPFQDLRRINEVICESYIPENTTSSVKLWTMDKPDPSGQKCTEIRLDFA